MLTLKKFRELTKDLPEDTIINTTIEFGAPHSIRGTINVVHIVPKEHSYAKENYITLTQDFGRSDLLVQRWVDKNKTVVEGENGAN